MSVQAIIEGAVTVQKGIEGIAQAWPNAPEQLSTLPAFVTVLKSFEVAWPRKPSIRDITWDFNMTLLLSRGGDLPAADAALKPFVDLVIAAFDQAITLGGACLAAGVSGGEYGKVEYAGVEFLGITFVLRAREIQQVVYAG